MAKCPSFGLAPTQPAVPEKVRRQASRRASSLCMNVSKPIGFIRLQTPPGLRKSGIPDSVDMPAPVKTTVRAEPARSAARRGIADMAALCGVTRTRGKSIPLADSRDGRHSRTSFDLETESGWFFVVYVPNRSDGTAAPLVHLN